MDFGYFSICSNSISDYLQLIYDKNEKLHYENENITSVSECMNLFEPFQIFENFHF